MGVWLVSARSDRQVVVRLWDQVTRETSIPGQLVRLEDHPEPERPDSAIGAPFAGSLVLVVDLARSGAAE